ncbi:hypothetical protein [Bifidobacterium boum]|uniref:hypothetical protein n=1 Tax=Bifidobacterium boum TaxID=78343 RepID=UPI003F8E19B3
MTGVKAGSTRIVATAGNVSTEFDVSVLAVSSMRVWYRPDSSSTRGVRLWCGTGWRRARRATWTWRGAATGIIRRRCLCRGRA